MKSWINIAGFAISIFEEQVYSFCYVRSIVAKLKVNTRDAKLGIVEDLSENSSWFLGARKY